MEIWLIILLSILGFILLCVIVIGIIGFNMIYVRKESASEYPLAINEERLGRFFDGIKRSYDNYLKIDNKEILKINSINNKELIGELIRNKENDKKEIPTVVIFAHGHHSEGRVDIALFHNFTFKNYDTLLIDHEGHGKSEGRYSGFGIYESENLTLWVKKINELYNHNVNIFLFGVSLGGNTVLLTSNKEMENVRGIISDCAFSSTYEIVKSISKLNFVAFSTCIISSIIIHRNVFRYNTRKCVKESKYPILFIHGKEDYFVPTWMSIKNDKICFSKHKLILFDNAKHAQSYINNPELYEKEFNEFINNNLK